MADHLHRWRVTKEPLEAICMVGSCEHELTLDEIELRLNATERLGAGDAREVADDIHGDWWPLEGTSPYEDALRAYAAALEGE